MCQTFPTSHLTPVADVELYDGRQALAHIPSSSFCARGQCQPGTELLLQPMRHTRGRLAARTTVDQQGAAKCEFNAQLALVSEPENMHIDTRGVWVGVHQSLGDTLAHEMLKRGLMKEFGQVVAIQRAVNKVCGTDMRADFVVTHKDGTRTALKVKAVVDTDHNPAIDRAQRDKDKIRFWGRETPYRRAAIYPRGERQAIYPRGERQTQRGPPGEHVDISYTTTRQLGQLMAIQTGEKLCPDGERLQAAILFLVNRADALSFRPNREGCPSFVNHLRKAKGLGVKVMAYRVAWGTGMEEGVAYFDGAIEVDL